MIYVLEIPEQGRPRAWFAYDDEDFSRKVAATDALEAWEIHDEVSARALLEGAGLAVDQPRAREQFPAICALADAHGWDTPLYRADHLLGRGVLRTQPVTGRMALAAALDARPGRHHVYWNDRDAIGAYEGADQRIAGADFWHARRALYQQLLALEVLADDN
jgi:hypothetical protein